MPIIFPAAHSKARSRQPAHSVGALPLVCALDNISSGGVSFIRARPSPR